MFDDYSMINNTVDTSEINMGPLIDMVFILLIFFIITTNFNRQTGIDVTKPKASTALAQRSKIVLIGITQEGTIHVYGRQVTPERLFSIVSQEVKKNPEVSVVIVADLNASIGKAVQIMDQCNLAGAQKVSIAAEKED
jgi:biopolymer transport protein ExbD